MENNSSNLKKNKKESIIKSARRLFIQKGYQSTSMRNIAKDADVNLALVNYYFNSKESLFDLIYNEIIEKLLSDIQISISEDNTTIENISYLIDIYTELPIKNPELTSFIFFEIYKNPSKLTSKIIKIEHFQKAINIFIQTARRDMNKGLIRQIDDPGILLFNVLSISIVPFLGKPIIKNTFNIDDKTFIAFMRKRKEEIINIFNIYLNPPK